MVDDGPDVPGAAVRSSVPGEWVLLSYRLPREPSTPRTALWRRLKQYGVAQVGDGLAALPADARTREQLEWLAEDVVQAAGTAGVWLARPTTAEQERELARQMAGARAQEYSGLAVAAREALDDDAPGRRRALRRLRKTWREVTRRDFFPPAERDDAAAALRDLAEATPAAPTAPSGAPAVAGGGR